MIQPSLQVRNNVDLGTETADNTALERETALAKLRARRVRLTRDGYEVGTDAYYGVGAPVYVVTDAEGNYLGTERASTPLLAKQKVVADRTLRAVF
jgi:hypothetical protein